jgi:hypothetical protein
VTEYMKICTGIHVQAPAVAHLVAGLYFAFGAARSEHLASLIGF